MSALQPVAHTNIIEIDESKETNSYGDDRINEIVQRMMDGAELIYYFNPNKGFNGKKNNKSIYSKIQEKLETSPCIFPIDQNCDGNSYLSAIRVKVR